MARGAMVGGADAYPVDLENTAEKIKLKQIYDLNSYIELIIVFINIEIDHNVCII
jgi:hypothetical protein